MLNSICQHTTTKTKKTKKTENNQKKKRKNLFTFDYPLLDLKIHIEFFIW